MNERVEKATHKFAGLVYERQQIVPQASGFQSVVSRPPEATENLLEWKFPVPIPDLLHQKLEVAKY